MKIALLGNMNNNNFSIMRYFRDLGADAHLLLWENDGVGGMSHFRPEADSWQMNKWSSFIHQTKISNSYLSIFGNPLKLKFPLTKSQVVEEFRDSNCIIGSGIAPALMNKTGRKLDIFYPYSTGVEFVGLAPSGLSIESEPWYRRLFLSYLRCVQVKGILDAKFCLNAELGPTKVTLDRIGKSFLPLAIPMVYNKDSFNEEEISEKLIDLRESWTEYDLKVFSHGRQLWKYKNTYTQSDWIGMNKNNDWLIRGFASFAATRKDCNPLLILLEYGPDVEASKKLCGELGIDSNVIWLPTMQRREIMFLLSLCDIGVGEFTVSPGCIWGGTGWEVLASGKPLMQTFNFSKAQFLESFGHDPPPLLDIKSCNDVLYHLLDYYENKEKYKDFGSTSQRWFDDFGGIGLAKKWLDLLVVQV